ncbi:hypothetical protein [Defluviimonas salinarum]|uniref:Uncharacterized protein n=1 Tax=Defluviimonas salinarum TaxID=2992147 RepID=A0ABT3J9Q4_9RHOB|nr:hypothetical protein [Defluviimonas salinarum]MCW3784427.1 hypothetical protein [Defluviimonas salinarum]
MPGGCSHLVESATLLGIMGVVAIGFSVLVSNPGYANFKQEVDSLQIAQTAPLTDGAPLPGIGPDDGSRAGVARIRVDVQALAEQTGRVLEDLGEDLPKPTGPAVSGRAIAAPR